MEKKYFTLEEANVLLESIKPTLMKVAGLMNCLNDMESIEITFDDDFKSYHHMINISEQYYKLSFELYKELKALLVMGCIVKDPSMGLIDFFSKHNNREIFLCYSLGEDKINCWHELEEGAAGRKPISLLQEN